MHYSYTRDAHGVLHERFGLPFEAIVPGQTFLHRPGITFTQQDNVTEALSTLNSAQVHYDESYAARTSWRRPLVVSTLTLQRLIGMTWKTFGLARRRIESMHDVRMTRPVFAGDTLVASTEVVEVACAGEARLRLRTAARNQHGEEVARADYTCLAWRSEEWPAALAPIGDPASESRFASHLETSGGWLENFGLAFEDLRDGETFEHALHRCVEPHEIASLARDALDWAARPPDQGAVPQSWLVGLATALTTLTLGRVSANLGWTDVRFFRDARAGDSLRARSTIESTRESRSRPDEGIVQVHTALLDAHGERVLDFRRTLLVYHRHAGPPDERASAEPSPSQ
ncbi:MAG: MaoC/PaaZ C-terminal domain-containing protein [Burkholderiaceae bacterium]